jgi:hypothetical protein
VQREQADARDQLIASLQARASFDERAVCIGIYSFVCRDHEGHLLWEAEAPNGLMDVGVQYLLNAISAAPTIAGPFLGLIGGAGTIAQGDTMGTHAGWTEVGGANIPVYTGNRPQPTFSAAAVRSKAITTPASYTFSGTGATVMGAFLVLGSGAVNTKDSTAGVLYSAGLFAPAQPVVAGNVLSVSYTTTLSYVP